MLKANKEAEEVLNSLGIDRSDISLLPLDFWLSLEHSDEFLTFETGKMETEKGFDYFFESFFNRNEKKSRKKILRLREEQWKDKNLIKELNHLYNPSKRKLIIHIISLNEQINKFQEEDQKLKKEEDSTLLNKKLILQSIKSLQTKEILHSLDLHTIDIVVSIFENTHGPFPIIASPEILRYNFDQLVELSDRSFSTAGFVTNFDSESFAFFDSLWTRKTLTEEEHIDITIFSFNFTLENPQARGGMEHFTLNILLKKQFSTLIVHFLEDIQEQIHSIHLLMQSKEKTKTIETISELRKFISSVILTYERIYELA
ncbi:MAG: hypothetical protein ACW964_02540 [Candidatus Hodarchaeales archaeon]|jgi:hypothetical protein